jgi:hypothetical protein
MRIARFPTPYPDELYFHICARYRASSGLKMVTILENLTGSRGTAISRYFAGNIGFLLENLPPGHSFTADELIFKHTLLPYSSFFVSSEIIRRCYEQMKSGEPRMASLWLGLNRTSVNNPSGFRFCPIYVHPDQNSFDEPYSHRVHQLPGVLVCPIHSVYLEQSKLSWTTALAKLSSAVEMVYEAIPLAIDFSLQSTVIKLQIAKDSLWLLSQNNQQQSLGGRSPDYVKMLHERGYGYRCEKGKRINRKRVVADFNDYCSESLIQELGIYPHNRFNFWGKILVEAKHVGIHPFTGPIFETPILKEQTLLSI